MENKELVLNDDKKAFNQALNKITGIATSNPRAMVIKFNAVRGGWARETEDKDAEGMSVWIEMGDTLECQIITTSRKYKKNGKSEHNFYSFESNNEIIKIYDQNKEQVFEGTVKDLKNDPIKKELTYVQVVYAYVKIVKDGEPVLHAIHLSGSNLVHWFEYLNSFDVDQSITSIITIIERGKRWKGVANGPSVEAIEADIASYKKDLENGVKPNITLYYDLLFHEGSELPQADIIKRVTDAMVYVNARLAYSNSVINKEQSQVIKDFDNAETDNTNLLGKIIENSSIIKQPQQGTKVDSTVKQEEKKDDINIKNIPF